MFATVVGGREDGDEGAACEPFETVHDALVGSDDEGEVVVAQEVLDSVRTELDDVASALWIADGVGMDASVSVSVGGVTPEDIDYQLLFKVADLVYHLEGSLELVYLLDVVETAADATMQTDDLVVDDGCERQVLE